jgi:hypothetical protein
MKYTKQNKIQHSLIIFKNPKPQREENYIDLIKGNIILNSKMLKALGRG